MAAQKSGKWWLYTKMLIGASVIAVGGPALTWYLMPTEGELFQKFNPELQKRSLEKRPQRQKEFDDFVVKLKEQSKSDKSIWTVQAEEARQEAEAKERGSSRLAEEAKARREEMRRQAGLSAESR